MKNTVGQIIKKDLRRFRGLLAMWCAVLVLRAGMHAWVDDGGVASGRHDAMFVMLLVLLLNGTLVARVLAEDSPAKEAAFWRTRPISAGQMLGAKCGLLAGATLVLPALIAFAAARWYGIPGGDAVSIGAEQVVLHAIVGALFGTVALFTTRVLSGVVGTLLGVVVLQVAMSATGVSGARASVDAEVVSSMAVLGNVSFGVTRIVLCGTTLICALGAAAWWMYRERARAKAVVALVVGAAGAWVVGTAWPLDLLAQVPALRKWEAREDERLKLVAEAADFGPGGISQRVSFLALTIGVEWSGERPGEVVLISGVSGALEAADGGRIEQHRWTTESDFGRYRGEALRQFGVERIRRSPTHEIEERLSLLRLRGEEGALLSGRELTWTGHVFARVGHLKMTSRMPLSSGAEWAEGASRSRVEKVSMEGSRVRMSVVERRIHRPSWQRGWVGRSAGEDPYFDRYVLINVRKGEALLPIGDRMRMIADGFFVSRSMDLIVPASSGMDVEDEWREWLRDAELITLEFVEERRVKVPLTVRVDDER